MKTRELALMPGAFGWAVSVPACRLHAFPHRTLVKIIENDFNKPTATVRDVQGTIAELPRINLLPRLEYFHEVMRTWHREKSTHAIGTIRMEITLQWERLQELKEVIEDLYWRIRRSGDWQSVSSLESALATHDPIHPFKPPVDSPTLAEKEIERLKAKIALPCPYHKPGGARRRWEEDRKSAIAKLRTISRPGYIYRDPDDQLPY